MTGNGKFERLVEAIREEHRAARESLEMLDNATSLDPRWAADKVEIRRYRMARLNTASKLAETAERIAKAAR